jgi:CRISPR-associated endonuclease Cas2
MKNKKRKVGEISAVILKSILYAGTIAIAATSPQFGCRIIPKIIQHLAWKRKRNKSDEKRFYNSFYLLRKKGLLQMDYRGQQLYISLTEDGKKHIRENQIDYLEIKKPQLWDHNWRVIIFDIKEKQRLKREALRGKLKELGLFKLQDSVWVCPYDFQKEVSILRNFFGLGKNEMKIIIASNIEDDGDVRKHFKL